jgi:hypothetical protein
MLLSFSLATILADRKYYKNKLSSLNVESPDVLNKKNLFQADALGDL